MQRGEDDKRGHGGRGDYVVVMVKDGMGVVAAAGGRGRGVSVRQEAGARRKMKDRKVNAIIDEKWRSPRLHSS